VPFFFFISFPQVCRCKTSHDINSYSLLIIGVYTHVFAKNYFVSTIGRDCKPKRLRIGSTLTSARFQTVKAVEALFSPFGVSVIFRTRSSSCGHAEIHPWSSIKRKVRDRVVRSRPSCADNSEIESGPVCASVARTVNWVARRPLLRKCFS
jgi:hypothetical protein